MEKMEQPALIGYRKLTDEEGELMNEGKALAVQVGAYVKKLKGIPPVFDAGTDVPSGGVDQRWVALGATQLQQGFMALARAVAKPTSF